MNVHQKASFLKYEIDRLLTDFPELEDDETLRADMFEAETDMERVISLCLAEKLEADSMADAIKERETALRERRTRFERKGVAMRRLIQSVMEQANLPKITLAEATLSLRDPVPSVDVTNVDDLPQGYFRVKKEADKTALKKALMAGEEIPGAVLSLGEGSVTIRTK